MNHEISVQVKNQLAEIHRLSALVEEFGRAYQWPDDVIFQINLVLDELVTNVISYGYHDSAEHLIDLRLKLSGDELTLVMEDDGKAFNPLEKASPQFDVPLEERGIGGLGIFLVRKLMDRVDYRREAGKNILVMMKRIISASPAQRQHLEISETKSGDAVVLKFAGRFDATTATIAMEKLSAALTPDKQRLVLDFSRLEFISSAGLQVLLVARNKLHHAQGKIVICSLKDYLKNIFDIAGFAKLFEIYATRAEALKRLQ